ncbi:MAG: FAD-dependent oxidoreductase [Cytophagales bacterium]|nr:FAD-dependent oxidoreductase [Cytophagales bacterium]
MKIIRKGFRLFNKMRLKRVAIIGGGIIGLLTVWDWEEAGYKVTVVDKNDFHDGCSYGNAGMIVPSQIVPMASPGVPANGLRWLFNPKSPLYINPGLDLNLASWLWKFFRSRERNN